MQFERTMRGTCNINPYFKVSLFEIRTFNCCLGEQGVRGDAGPEGPAGKVKQAIGETGLTGLKGQKGESGDYGTTGKMGSKGQDGPKGKRNTVYVYTVYCNSKRIPFIVTLKECGYIFAII